MIDQPQNKTARKPKRQPLFSFVLHVHVGAPVSAQEVENRAHVCCMCVHHIETSPIQAGHTETVMGRFGGMNGSSDNRVVPDVRVAIGPAVRPSRIPVIIVNLSRNPSWLLFD